MRCRPSRPRRRSLHGHWSKQVDVLAGARCTQQFGDPRESGDLSRGAQPGFSVCALPRHRDLRDDHVMKWWVFLVALVATVVAAWLLVYAQVPLSTVLS